MDCFVAFAPRNDDPVSNRHTSTFSRRDAPELCRKLLPPKTEGVGNAGCPMHPQPPVQQKSTGVEATGPPDSPGIPARNGFNGFLRALPGDRAWLSPSPGAVYCAELDASVGASGPHDFAVRLSAVRQRHCHVHRIPPRVRDDREPPPCGTGQRGKVK